MDLIDNRCWVFRRLLGLLNPGSVLLKHHVRTSKFDPYVDKVELIHATLSYARVRMQNGRNATESLRDIAPVGKKSVNLNECADDVDSKIFDADTTIASENVTYKNDVCVQPNDNINSQTHDNHTGVPKPQAKDALYVLDVLHIVLRIITLNYVICCHFGVGECGNEGLLLYFFRLHICHVSFDCISCPKIGS